VVLAPGGSQDGVDVTLRAAGVVRGQVVDSSGDAVGGATVWSERGGAFGGISSASGDDGSFALSGLPVGKTRVLARADAYMNAKPVPVTVPKLDDGSPGEVDGVVLTLEGGASLSGATTLADGTPVATRVAVFDARGRSVKAVAGDDAQVGTYQLGGLGAGSYQVAAGPASGAVARTQVSLGAGEAKHLDLVLAAGGTIAGSCVDAQGQPVQGVRVRAAAQGIGFSASGSSGTDGRFVVPGLIDAAYVVSARPPEGFAPPGSLHADVAGGEGPQDLAFQLDTGATISGRVAAPDGGPAGGAQVTVGAGAPGGSETSAGSIEAGPDGAFRLARLPAGPVEVYAKWGHDGARQALTLGASDDRTIALTAAPLARIRGVCAGGAGLNVTVVSLEGLVKRTARCDKSGAFDVPDLYDGRYLLTVASKAGTSDPVEVGVSPGQDLEGVTLRAPGS
jgi:hypothetical protein